MSNKIKKELKDNISFFQTIENETYKTFYNKCKKRGLTIQSQIRILVAEFNEKNQ